MQHVNKINCYFLKDKGEGKEALFEVDYYFDRHKLTSYFVTEQNFWQIE